MEVSPSFFDTSIEYLKGVGPARGELLKKELGISTFGDLLYHFPYRYIDSRQIDGIGNIRPGQEWVQVRGKLTNIRQEGQKYKNRLVANLYDKTGEIELVWFRGVSYFTKILKTNTPYSIFGKVSNFNGKLNMVHPEMEVYKPDQPTPPLQPVYSSTEKLTRKGISNRRFAHLQEALFEKIGDGHIQDFLPEEMLKKYRLMPLNEALRQVHFPKDEIHRDAALFRLKWEEFLLLHLRMGKLKLQQQQHAGFKFDKVGTLFNEFYSDYLPFAFTKAQKRVIREIRQDTNSGHQMNRLLQGDVGSGKTIVAVMCMLLALDNGFQACLMAPTEILARQHYEDIKKLLQKMPIEVRLLIGKIKGKPRKNTLTALAEGSCQIVIGTHALVEDKVVFKNLGLSIIDEQHRFGVAQRSKLWTKNKRPPHVLVMTATPIPRTLSMTVYGDLEISVIDELPPGRKPIQTVHRTEHYRAQVMQFIRQEIHAGRQIYIVYPLIDESEKMDYESLMAGIQQVKSWFPEPEYKVGMVHGKQPSEERERNMKRFVEGYINILVATTVIEVGVNVPNASVMIIESAERFGLSQLHQLRGRVGRGSDKSYCILLTGVKMSRESRQRMEIMVRTQDGFEIAGEDLKLRGPGNIHGTQQSGALKLNIGDVVNDTAIIENAKVAATELLEKDADLSLPQHRSLKIRVRNNAGGGNQVLWSDIS